MLLGCDSDVTFLMIGAEKRGISVVKATDTVAAGAGLKSGFPLMELGFSRDGKKEQKDDGEGIGKRYLCFYIAIS